MLCLGLSGSGKSTLLAQLVGENTANIVPTDGFNIKTLPINGIVLSIKELGGSERVQTFWTNYYDDKHALIFVVDSSSSDSSLQESINTLRKILSNQSFRKRPCMVLGTHKDKPQARTHQQMEDHFREVLLDHEWALVCCSAFDRHSIQNAMCSLSSLINVFP